MYTISELVSIIDGKIISQSKGSEIGRFFIDSRLIPSFQNACFIAIKGDNHNGHDYLPELYNVGIRSFIVEEAIKAPGEGCTVLKVENGVVALQQIAAFHRRQNAIQTIGVTGSNGKTMVKEWLGQMLALNYNLVKSPKSYNSQIGVALSVLLMEPWNDLGIFEAGISQTGEMERLNLIIQPDIALFTNIGTAHDDGFASTREKIREKWKLAGKNATLIYCHEHILIHEERPKGNPTFSWGKESTADVQLVKVNRLAGGFTQLEIIYKESFTVTLKFSDDASIENAMHVITACLYLGLSHQEISKKIMQLKSVPMRMELKEGINGCYLVDDTYNNDFAGLNAALDFLVNQTIHKKYCVILSEIFQSGKTEDELYKQVAQSLNQKNIDTLYAIGIKSEALQQQFNGQFFAFSSTEDFLAKLDPTTFRDQLILIKGARTYSMERIISRLQKKVHGTVLEINLDALTHNLNVYRNRLQKNVKLMVMVKAFAYGSGLYEVANLLQFHKVDYLGVAYPDEGVELRQLGVNLPIMVMNCTPDSIGSIIENKLEPEIFSLLQLQEFAEYSKMMDSKLLIHLKLDTGMKRLGFEKENLAELIEVLRLYPHIVVQSIFTHLAAADEEEHNEFSDSQISQFIELSELLMKELRIKPLRHVLNSPGIMRFPQYQFDMVRLGIGLYGVEASGIHDGILQHVGTLKTVVSQVKTLSIGDSVGYGRKGKAEEEEKKIATVAIGYADGYSRSFSNGKGVMSVNGKLAPVIGNVCMDMTMIDVTGITVKEGDIVTVFGEDPSIEKLAGAIDTIPYEILTDISQRVKRIFYSG